MKTYEFINQGSNISIGFVEVNDREELESKLASLCAKLSGEKPLYAAELNEGVFEVAYPTYLVRFDAKEKNDK